MKNNFLIIGLGNPGKQYLNTRHNVGFLVLDYLSNFFELKKRNSKYYILSERFFVNNFKRVKVFFMYPLTYMNNSGLAVKNFFHNRDFNSFQVIVIHDDLDMSLGKIKIKLKSGHGGHNGVKSIIEELNSNDFIRVKIGIDRPAKKDQIPEYVLSEFSKKEREKIFLSIKKAANITINLLFNPIEKVQSAILN